jgi:EAL and modified HD-GYP domain-containing signal transduction protein
MLDVFVGRQAIYNRQLEVFAYELLFRSGVNNYAVIDDGDRATSQVILNTFMEIGLEKIVGEKMAFINLTRSFILGSYLFPFPQTRIGLEILEDIHVDAGIIDSIRKLSAQGYLIVLDDFVYHEELRPLVEVADIIKLDILALGRAGVSDHMKILKKYGIEMLAEKVETQDDFEFCKKLGFHYFQGYFFCQPLVIKGQRIPVNRLAILQILSKLQDPDIDMQELEALVCQDASMSYKLLRCVNSSVYSLPAQVESIGQLLTILGQQGLKTWASLIALSSIDDKPHELLKTALIRAKMCELVAVAMKYHNKECFFTVGLFSVLDALMDVPMQKLLNTLPVSADISQALLQHQGVLGEALQCVLAYERGDWDNVTCFGLARNQITHAYLDAVSWADQAGRELLVTTLH